MLIDRTRMSADQAAPQENILDVPKLKVQKKEYLEQI